MKSIKLFLIVFFVIISSCLSAQVFVGGNASFNFSGGKNADDSKKPSMLNLGLSPKFGKFLSEKVAAGISLNFSVSSENNNAPVATISTASSIGVNPFIRYYALKFDKFSIFGQGNVGFSFSGSSFKTGNDKTDGPKSNTISLNVVPGLSYDLSDKISLETSINVLNVGFSQTTIKSGTAKSTSTSFGAGAGLNNIVNLGGITIGAIYKF